MGSLCSGNNPNSEQGANEIVQTKVPTQSNGVGTVNPTQLTAVTSVDMNKHHEQLNVEEHKHNHDQLTTKFTHLLQFAINHIPRLTGIDNSVDIHIQPSSTTYLGPNPESTDPTPDVEQLNVPTVLRIHRLEDNSTNYDADYPFVIRDENDRYIEYLISEPNGLRFGTTEESRAATFHLELANIHKNLHKFLVSYNVATDDTYFMSMNSNGTAIEGSKENSTQLTITVARPKEYFVSEYEFDFPTANAKKTNITTGVEVSQKNVSCWYNGGSSQNAQINIEFELNLQSIFKLEFSNDEHVDGSFTFYPKIEVNYDNGDLQLTEDALKLNNFKDTFTYGRHANDYGILNIPISYSSTVFIRNRVSRFLKAYLVMTRATVTIPFSATFYNSANGDLKRIENTDAHWTGYVYYNPTIRVTELDGTPFGGT